MKSHQMKLILMLCLARYVRLTLIQRSFSIVKWEVDLQLLEWLLQRSSITNELEHQIGDSQETTLLGESLTTVKNQLLICPLLCMNSVVGNLQLLEVWYESYRVV